MHATDKMKKRSIFSTFHSTRSSIILRTFFLRNLMIGIRCHIRQNRPSNHTHDGPQFIQHILILIVCRITILTVVYRNNFARLR